MRKLFNDWFPHAEHLAKGWIPELPILDKISSTFLHETLAIGTLTPQIRTNAALDLW